MSSAQLLFQEALGTPCRGSSVSELPPSPSTCSPSLEVTATPACCQGPGAGPQGSEQVN